MVRDAPGSTITETPPAGRSYTSQTFSSGGDTRDRDDDERYSWRWGPCPPRSAPSGTAEAGKVNTGEPTTSDGPFGREGYRESVGNTRWVWTCVEDGNAGTLWKEEYWDFNGYRDWKGVSKVMTKKCCCGTNENEIKSQHICEREENRGENNDICYDKCKPATFWTSHRDTPERAKKYQPCKVKEYACPGLTEPVWNRRTQPQEEDERPSEGDGTTTESGPAVTTSSSPTVSTRGASIGTGSAYAGFGALNIIAIVAVVGILALLIMSWRKE